MGLITTNNPGDYQPRVGDVWTGWSGDTVTVLSLQTADAPCVIRVLDQHGQSLYGSFADEEAGGIKLVRNLSVLDWMTNRRTLTHRTRTAIIVGNGLILQEEDDGTLHM